MKIHLYDPRLGELALHHGATIKVPRQVTRRFRFSRVGVHRTLVLVVLWAISAGHILPSDEVRCVSD
jgi:hypothetical protein